MSEPKDKLIDRNHERADRALAGVIAYQALAGYPVDGHEREVAEIAATMPDSIKRFGPEDLGTSVVDLVNVMHLAARDGFDREAILARATRSYTEEQEEP